jgi:pyruvate/2-oxoglutarate dehydrogenase complex dihydrolipoamide dehydrogenase (E3) component
MWVLFIECGPAGVPAALYAAELGAEVTLIERGRVGGNALNSGTASVRTLAREAEPSGYAVMDTTWRVRADPCSGASDQLT